MANKAAELFARLPSVNELLEKPPVRALADRWNRSTVAAGVRSFLDELRQDLERRAADFQMPSLRDLAERAARHVAAQQQSALRPGINATGQFFGPQWSTAPLADEALERIIAVSRGYVPSSAGASHSDSPTAAVARVCRLTVAEAALVVSSYSGAVSFALAAIASNREVVVGRGEVCELADGSSLSGVAQAAGVQLRETGAVNRTTAGDYEATITGRTTAILRHTPERFRIAGDVQFVDEDALVALARDRELPLVELLGSAPLIDNLPGLAEAPASAAARIAAGSNLVIFRGDGLVGGPRCGIIAGTRRLIHQIASHPLQAAWQADPISLAALDAVLAIYDDPQRLPLALPLFQLLTTSCENLRQRAERLAPQMAQASDVASAVAVECESSLGLANLTNDKMPSHGIVLAPADGNVQTLEKRLRRSPVPILARRRDDQLLIDLRTVLPRQDQSLVDMTIGASTQATETAPETAVPANV